MAEGVESGGLRSRNTRKGVEGSNPFLSFKGLHMMDSFGIHDAGRVAVCPHRLAGGQLVAGDDLIGTALLLGVEKVAADREG